MAKSMAESLKDLSNESIDTFSGFPIVIPSGGNTYLPTADGLGCNQKPKKSFTLECDGAADIYIQGRIGTSGNWCTLKKRDSDADNKFTIAAGGGSVWIACEVPIEYIRLWFVNTAGADNTITNMKVKMGR